MRHALICDAIRTPVGRYGGALSAVRADDLAASALSALSARNPGLSGIAEEVFFGCANQAGEDNRNVARMALLLAGFSETVPGVTVNRLCASGLEAVSAAARAIIAGDMELAVAGGVESMSRAPFVMGKAESPFQRAAALEDTTIGWRFVNPRMREAHGVDTMPETAENVADEHGISREDQDAFALRSQNRAARAAADGVFAAEIAPVAIPQRKGDPRIVDYDEHRTPRRTSSQGSTPWCAREEPSPRATPPASMTAPRPWSWPRRRRPNGQASRRAQGSSASRRRASRPGSWASGRSPPPTG